jgi:site-specific recombinase XerC
LVLEPFDGTLLPVRDAGKSYAAAAHGDEIRTVQALLGHADIRTT